VGTWDALRPCDQQVEAALAAGDIPQAFCALVEGYGKYVVQYCRVFLGHKADGEDVAHDTFLAIHDAFTASEPQYPPEGLLRAWVFRFARYHCLRYRRKFWNRIRILEARAPDILESVMADPTPRPEVVLTTSTQIRLQQFGLDLLEPSLRRLPTYDRKLLMMHYWEKLSFQVMADQLDCSPSTVLRHVHAAEARLLARMTKEEHVNGIDDITSEAVG
jgi:RNA polymerase sigma factor (sigma-70 family)